MDRDPEIPADDGALERLLRDRRLGQPASGDLNPWDFLQRWPQDVRARRVWPVVSRLLGDADDAVRARSLEFVEGWSDGIEGTAPRVAELGERHPELFGAQDVEGVTLRDQYARTASTLSMYCDAKRFARVLRRLAVDGPLAGSASAVIAEQDPGFVIAQTKKWGGRAAGWALAATSTFAVYHRDELVDFLRAAAVLDAQTREQILARVELVIRRDDAAAAKATLEKGLPAPHRPAPTPEECRQSIGL
jgi:hypothetical protein